LIITDADTTLKENAIREVAVDFIDPQVGAVTGKMEMANYAQSTVTKLEKSYRSMFDMIRIGESNIDSTPIFNGPLVALRRNLFEPLDSNSIADDTEISMMIREKGYRSIFEPRATVYATTPRGLQNRAKQKIRRGRGIIQSFFRHRKALFNRRYGKYGALVFPCEFFMTIISPALFFMAAILIAITSVLYPLFMGIVGIIACSTIVAAQTIFFSLRRRPNNSAVADPLKMLESVLEHQIILFLGLFTALLKRTNVKWERVSD
jgi:cellulose synthase/poly-beta-1,6-N-acetylglucosamine synthase-like glycosyltransferase